MQWAWHWMVWQWGVMPVMSQTPGCALYIIHLSQTPWCASYLWARLHGVHHTFEPDSTVCIIPLSQTPRCASYLWARLLGVHHTFEPDFMVCIIPLNQTPWCASYLWARLHGVHHTFEPDSTVCIAPYSQTLWCALCNLYHTAQFDSAHPGVRMNIYLHLFAVEMVFLRDHSKRTQKCIIFKWSSKNQP